MIKDRAERLRKSREYQKRRWREHGPRCRELAKATRIKAKIRNQRHVRAYLAERSCTDCGGSFHFSAMDFDHVRGTKFMAVSHMASRAYDLDRIKAEIAKCDIRCANCHRVKTWKERQG